jgi:hypothetical protein
VSRGDHHGAFVVVDPFDVRTLFSGRTGTDELRLGYLRLRDGDRAVAFAYNGDTRHLSSFGVVDGRLEDRRHPLPGRFIGPVEMDDGSGGVFLVDDDFRLYPLHELTRD